MEAKRRRVPTVIVAIIVLALHSFALRLLPYYYEDAILAWENGVLTAAVVLLLIAYHFFFIKNKRAVAVIMAVIGFVAVLAFISTIPKYTRQQAAEVLRDKIPELGTSELTESDVRHLMAPREYIITFRDGGEWRNFVVDPNTLEYFEEDNVLMWYYEKYPYYPYWQDFGRSTT